MRRHLLTAALLLGLGACSSENTPAGQSAAAAGAAGAMSYAPAPCPATIPEFRPGGPGMGLEVVGSRGLARARLVGADPLTPQRYYNDWSVDILDAQGAPLAGVEIANACAWMAVHRHGGAPDAVVPGTQPGRFDLKKLNLTMYGPWEVELAINAPSLTGARDTATDCDSRSRMAGAEIIKIPVCVPMSGD